MQDEKNLALAGLSLRKTPLSFAGGVTGGSELCPNLLKALLFKCDIARAGIYRPAFGRVAADRHIARPAHFHVGRFRCEAF